MPRRLVQFFTRPQIAALLAQPNVRCRTGLRNRVMMETMYRAGLRVGEVVALKPAPDGITWEDRGGCDRGGGWLNIRKAKGGKARMVPIPHTLAEWLARWELARPPDAECFFCAVQDRSWSPAGSQLTTKYVWEMVKREGAQAGLPPDLCHPHTLRHTYATELLKAGVTIKHISELLGHSGIGVTADTYLHLQPADLQSAVEGWDEAQRAQPVPGKQPLNLEEIARMRDMLDQMELAQLG